jgi:hypothetical protein
LDLETPGSFARGRVIAVLLSTAVLGACGDDPPKDPNDPATHGTLTLRVRHTVGATPFEPSTRYETPFGDSFFLDSLRYIVSDLALERGDGRMVRASFPIEAAIDARSESTASVTIADVPTGAYETITLRMGLADERNQVINDAGRPDAEWLPLAWPETLGGGYHVLLAQGRAGVTGSLDSVFAFALGRQVFSGHPTYGDTTVHHDFVADASVGSFTIAEGETTTVELRFDFREWLTPHFFDLGRFREDTRADVDLLTQIRQNGQDVFHGGSDGEPAVLEVPADFSTIQAAIDASSPGDTVLVADGVYTGPGNVDLDFSSLTSPFPNNIVVRSRNGPLATIIDVQGSPERPRRGFIFHSGEDTTSVLDGFTIRNGWMGSSPIRTGRHDLSGGGIIIRFLRSGPIIRNCIIESCYSEFSGGGLEAEVGGEPIIEDCLFIGNRCANFGGALSFESGAAATMRRCVITGNIAGTGGGGVAVRAPTIFESCTVSGNVAGSVGGGFGVGTGGGVEVRQPGTAFLDRCVVWGNCAPDSGNNVYVEQKGQAEASLVCSVADTTGGPTPPSLVLDRCVFEDPRFCEPIACESAPTSAGDVHVEAASPCLAPFNPCGVSIGAAGEGCNERRSRRWE